MPYADRDKQRAAERASKRRRRAREGTGLVALAGDLEVAADLPEPPSRDDLLKALGVQARGGNVPAIRLLLEEYRRDGDSDEDEKPKSVIDELSQRRQRSA